MSNTVNLPWVPKVVGIGDCGDGLEKLAMSIVSLNCYSEDHPVTEAMKFFQNARDSLKDGLPTAIEARNLTMAARLLRYEVDKALSIEQKTETSND